MKKSKVKPNWSDAATTAENEVLPRWLKWAWTSRGMSLAINVILIAQITYYCTDMLGMSATLVGALLLASKVFDGVTDLLAGVLIDRTHTYGQGKTLSDLYRIRVAVHGIPFFDTGKVWNACKVDLCDRYVHRS